MKRKIKKYLIFLIFMIFLVTYIVSKSGYYDYYLQSKSALTHKQIKQFEEDIKEGKDVDINDYIKETDINYSSNLGNNIINITNICNNIINSILKVILKIIKKIIC